MNGFSTEEDSHDGPPAPPFFGQSCCLIEDGERCGRPAGNASFSKRIQKSISQRKLKLDIDKSVSRFSQLSFLWNYRYRFIMMYSTSFYRPVLHVSYSTGKKFGN